MKKQALSILVGFFLLSLPVIIYGQGFNGPGAGAARPGRSVAFFEPIPVSQARTLPKESWVVLSGYIINTLPGGKHFTFRDSLPLMETSVSNDATAAFSAGGEITVEIEPRVWRGLSVEAADRVIISGEVDVKKGQVSIEVKAISGSGRMNARQGQAVTTVQPISLSEVKNLPNNSWVIMTGNIVSASGRERYTFREASASPESGGEITLEIEREVWRGLTVGVSDRVEIHGSLKVSRGQYSIDVKAIRGL